MKVYQKLLLGLALVALLVGCVGYVAQTMNRQVERGVVRLSQSAVQELNAATEMRLALRQSRAAAQDLIASRDTALASAMLAALGRFEEHLAQGRSVAVEERAQAERGNRSSALAGVEERLAALDDIGRAFRIYRHQSEQLSARIGQRSGGAHVLLFDVIEPQVEQALLPALTRYHSASRLAFDGEATAVQGYLKQADQFLFVSVLFAIGLTLVLGILIAQSISGPLESLTEATKRIGRGRWDPLTVRSSDEVGELAGAFNRMTEELSRTTVTKGYLDNILHSMADPLVVVDTTGEIVLVNRAVHTTLGYAREALVGQSLGVLFADGHPAADAVLAEVLAWGFTGRRETAFRTKELAELPVAFSAAIMRGEEGEVQGIVCVAKDVTDQKLFEAELIRAKEEAEAMGRMKSNFLANMSHEIRTPLTGIIGSAQVLTNELAGDHLEMVEIIERAGVRLLGTINSVLDMARIEAGELHPLAEPLGLASEVADAVSVLDRLAKGKGLSLTVAELTPGVWAAADPGFLHRILNNLIGNAIKFTNEGGVTVEIDAEGETAVLRVRDTGVGISDGFLPQLFDDFKQESTGIQRAYEGTGLGLAITQKLVALMEGQIDVESVKNVGSTFTVRLPRYSTPPPAVRRAAPSVSKPDEAGSAETERMG